MNALKAQMLGVNIGDRQILKDISFELQGGELCGLIGPSGAGKSTLIRLMLGLQSPNIGQVTIGRQAEAEQPMGYVPQDDALHRSLTVAQALDFAAQLRLHHQSAEAQQARIAEVVEQVGLAERMDVRIKALSGGQRKRVSVALELLNQPQLLILDEPTSGLDPGLEAKMMGLFKNVARSGRIVVVATHAMQSLSLCDRLMVLVQGRLTYAGPPAHALEWFETDTFAGIFEKIPQHAPVAWAAKWRNDGGRLPQVKPSLTPVTPNITELEPASLNEPLVQPPTSLEAKLAALKARKK